MLPASGHRRSRATWWNGLAAACVIGLCSLLVLRVNDVSPPDVAEREADVGNLAERRQREPAKAANAAPPVPTADQGAIAPPAVAEPSLTPAPSVLPAPTKAPAERDRAAPLSPPAVVRAPETNPAWVAAPVVPPRPQVEPAIVPRAFPEAALSAPVGRAAESGRQAAPAVTSRPDAAAERAELLPSGAAPPAAADAADGMMEPGLRAPALGVPRAAPSAATAQSPAPALAVPSGLARSGQAKAAGSPPWPPDGLIAAVEAGNLARIRQQLQSADADAERDAAGRSALAHAVLRSNLPAVELLLAAGADSRLPDRLGRSALDHAESIGNDAILAALRRR